MSCPETILSSYNVKIFQQSLLPICCSLSEGVKADLGVAPLTPLLAWLNLSDCTASSLVMRSAVLSRLFWTSLVIAEKFRIYYIFIIIIKLQCYSSYQSKNTKFLPIPCGSVFDRADKNNRKGLALDENFNFLDASSHSRYLWSSLDSYDHMPVSSIHIWSENLVAESEAKDGGNWRPVPVLSIVFRVLTSI